MDRHAESSLEQTAKAPGAMERVASRPHAAEVLSAYSAHGPALKRFVRGLVSDEETADDIVQETFLRLVQQLQANGALIDARPWLYRVAGNLARSRTRRARIAERWSWLFAARGEAAPAPDETAIRRDEHDHIERALRVLPIDARSAFLLSVDGFSGHEIADILGRSHGSTRTLLWRARLALREALEPEGIR